MSRAHNQFIRLAPLLVVMACMIMACEPGNKSSGTAAIERGVDGGCILHFSYEIGDVSPEFGISDGEIELAIDGAFSIWAEAFDSLNITRSADAKNQIRFVYDYRRQYSEEMERAESILQQRHNLLQNMEADIGRTAAQVEELMESHNRSRERLELESAGFNAWVTAKNEAGGFRDSEMREYNQRRLELAQIESTHIRLQSDLNARIEEKNLKIERFNREVVSLNALSKQFEEQFGEAFSFASGEYTRTGNTGEIAIYHFQSKRELKVVLAHEIGHAFGLDHVPGSRSIMYRDIRDQLAEYEIRLSQEDIQAADRLCR